MNKINEMEFKDILMQIGDIRYSRLQPEDFINFSSVGTMQEEFTKVNNESIDEMLQFFLDNEKDIDKEKLLFCIYLKHKEHVKKCNEKIQGIKNSSKDLSEFDKAQISAYNIAIKASYEYMEKISDLIKDIDIYLIDREKNRIGNYIISSRKELGSKRKESQKELKRIEKIEIELSKKRGKQLTDIIKYLSISDLTAIMPTYKLGSELKEFILSKILTNKGREPDELSKDRYNEIPSNEYCDLLVDAIVGSINFIDVDKLLLIIGYRIQEALEVNSENEDEIKELKSIITDISNAVINKDIKFKEFLEDKVTAETKEIEYSYDDMENFLARFVGSRYITKSQSDDIKQAIINGRMTLENSEVQDTIAIIYLTEDEVNNIMGYSTANFEFAIKILKLNEEEIEKKLEENGDLISLSFINKLYNEGTISIHTLITLYNNQKINAEFCIKFSEENNISSEVNLQKINEEYLSIKKSENTNQDVIINLNILIEFYKIINYADKSTEELQEQSDNAMNTIGEIIEDEEDLLFYYRNRLITLQTVADWSGKSTIEKLYKESEITFEDIEDLNMESKIKQSILEKIIIENIETYETANLLKYIYKGYLSEEYILKIYELALLNVKYADGMLNKGIISSPIYIQINDIDKNLLAKQAGIESSKIEEMQAKEFNIELDGEMEKSKIALNDIPLSKQRNIISDESKNDSKYYINEKKPEILINPSLRWAFLRTLKCKRPADDGFLHRNPESPFYDYDFFIIETGESEEAQKDSIIIGERFFKDRVNEDEFATLNATYIWRYEDYLVAKRIAESEQQKNKKAITKETNGIVYVANHRAGSWAVRLLYKVAQALAGESFIKYKMGDERATKVIEQLERLYTPQELYKILEMARILDDEEKLVTQDGKEIDTLYEVTYDKRVAKNYNKKTHVDHEDNEIGQM